MDTGRRDLMRQLQAWWDLHAYYPKHASNNDEIGSVKLNLLIYPDGRIWTVDVVQSSGSNALDTAATSAFRSGFVRPLPDGLANAIIDLSAHYVLAHRHDEILPANYTPLQSKRPFIITNDPVKSPILEKMMQKSAPERSFRRASETIPFTERIIGLKQFSSAGLMARYGSSFTKEVIPSSLRWKKSADWWSGPVEKKRTRAGVVDLRYAPFGLTAITNSVASVGVSRRQG